MAIWEIRREFGKSVTVLAQVWGFRHDEAAGAMEMPLPLAVDSAVLLGMVVGMVAGMLLQHLLQDLHGL